jgi:hypothetical protein
LGEFSAYYANRMSYEEVEGLLERLTGEKLLSDQTIWRQVVGQAVAISQPGAEASPAAEPIETALEVAWDDCQTAEVLVLSDAIQVKQQKPRRYRAGQKPAADSQRERGRVNTDVWMVQRAGGSFRYLTAGISAAGEEILSVEAQVQHCVQTEYGGRAAPLLVLAMTDGAKSIRCQLETVFGHSIPVIRIGITWKRKSGR